jgi:hypothetical protein
MEARMIQFRFAARTALIALFLSGGLFAGLAGASNTASFQGNLAADHDKVIFNINLTAPAGGTISVQSLSYFGGTNAAGGVVTGGGFAPVLVLFDSAGWEAFRASANVPCAGPGFCWDAGLSSGATATGSYTLVLSQDGNLPNGNLPNGYTQDDSANAHYTAQYGCTPNDPNALFIQIDCEQRSSLWALDLAVVGGTVAAVPEPAGTAMLVVGLAALALWRRRQAPRCAARSAPRFHR